MFHPSQLYHRWTEFHRLFIDLDFDRIDTARKGALACWCFLVTCWNVDRFCTSRRFIRLPWYSKHSLCIFSQFGFASTRGFVGLSVAVLFRVVFFTTCVLIVVSPVRVWVCDYLGQVHALSIVLPFYFNSISNLLKTKITI